MNVYWDDTVVSGLNIAAWQYWVVRATPEDLQKLRQLALFVVYHEEEGFSRKEMNYTEDEARPRFDSVGPGNERLLPRLCRNLRCLRCRHHLGGFDFFWRGPWSPLFGSVPPAESIALAYFACYESPWPQGLSEHYAGVSPEAIADLAREEDSHQPDHANPNKRRRNSDEGPSSGDDMCPPTERRGYDLHGE